MKQEISKYIQPFRNIPFDLGAEIDDTDKEQIEELIKKNKFTTLEIPLMMSKFSEDVIYRIGVSENIRLYIYSYGIGVFAIKDKVFPIDNDKYAYLYCCERKSPIILFYRRNMKI